MHTSACTHTSTFLIFMEISTCLLLACIHMPENDPLVEERTNKMDY